MTIDIKLVVLCAVFLVPTIISAIATYIMAKMEMKQLKIILLHLLTLEEAREDAPPERIQMTKLFRMSLHGKLFGG